MDLTELITASPILALSRRDGLWLVYVPEADPRLPASQCVAVLVEPGRPMRPMVSASDVPAILAGMARAVGRAVRAPALVPAGRARR